MEVLCPLLGVWVLQDCTVAPFPLRRAPLLLLGRSFFSSPPHRVLFCFLQPRRPSCLYFADGLSGLLCFFYPLACNVGDSGERSCWTSFCFSFFKGGCKECGAGIDSETSSGRHGSNGVASCSSGSGSGRGRGRFGGGGGDGGDTGGGEDSDRFR